MSVTLALFKQNMIPNAHKLPRILIAHFLFNYIFIKYLFICEKYFVLVLGDMVIFHIVISPACEIADTRYYRAWAIS